jgi:hypothetical protein
MSFVKNRLRRFELVLKPLLDIARSDPGRAPRFPAQGASRSDSLLAVSLSRIQPSRGEGTTLSCGALFSSGGSVTKGRIRHFNERNFVAVPAPSFAQVGDIRREARIRRLGIRQEVSRKRSVLDVLLRR